MKNHVRVRIGSALLSLTMALSLLPASALAAEIPSVHTEEDVSTSVPVEETQGKITMRWCSHRCRNSWRWQDRRQRPER